MSVRVAYSSVHTAADQGDQPPVQGPLPGQRLAAVGEESAPPGMVVEMAPPVRTRKWRVFPGRNRFCCDGRLMTSKQPGVFYLTCALIVITTGLFLAFDCRYLSVHLTPAVPVVAVLLFIFVMCTLLRTAFSDPGIIPRATADEAADAEKRTEVQGPSGPVQVPQRIKEVEMRGVTIKLKFCFTFKIFRPPRASHCSVCDNCVDRFDHHCPWVGNCVGRRNYRYFYLFLVALSVDCAFILGLSVTTLVLSSMDSNFLTAIKESPASLVEAIVAFLSIWSVLGLAGFHTYLALCNITTNEDIKSANLKAVNVSSIYSYGSLCTNFLEVVCGPVQPSLIDRRGIVTLSVDENQTSVPTNSFIHPPPESGNYENHAGLLYPPIENQTFDNSKVPILTN